MNSTVVERHRTAIRRGDYSRPVKCLLRDNLLGSDISFFDYGCGKGEDVELLTAAGVTCGAWDARSGRTRRRPKRLWSTSGTC